MPRLAVSSSAAEWASKGKELFDRKKYLQAKHCYERAMLPREMAISHAYFLRDQARKASTGDSRGLKEIRRNAFAQAAEAFFSCAEEAHKNKTIYYHNAGECFEIALDNVQAAQAYVQAQEYEVAAKLYRKLGMFDEAVTVIKENEAHMRADVVNNIKDVARLYYFREQALE
jgi:tetratricopeptide (TPR) repeat protein